MIVTGTPNVNRWAIVKYLGVVRVKTGINGNPEAEIATKAQDMGANAVVCYQEQYSGRFIYAHGTAVVIEQI